MPGPNVFLTTEDVGAKSSRTGSNPATPIVALLMKSVNDAHITHLMQPDKTLALHTALKKYYDGNIEDIIDTLQEQSMGIYNETDIKVEGSSKITNCTKYFQELYTKIEQLRKPIKETFLQSIVDEVQAEIAHTLYRLKNITA